MDALTALEQSIVPGGEELLATTMRDVNERWQHLPLVADFPMQRTTGTGTSTARFARLSTNRSASPTPPRSRLVAVQNQFSPRFRSSEDELQLCAELGLAFLPWSPLGGIGRASAIAVRGIFQQIANEHGVSPQQVCLAWELSLSPTVIPIPGASRPDSITDSARAADLELTTQQLHDLSGHRP